MAVTTFTGIPGISTSTEMHIEKALQPVERWQVLARTRTDRSLLGVEIEAQHGRDGHLEIYRLSLTPLWQINARHPSFPREFGSHFTRGLINKVHVVIDHTQHLVAFGPMGNVVLVPEEIRGCGLTPYALSRVIRWLHQGPAKHYAVQAGLLSGVDGKDPINRVRRDRCYRSVGFVVRSNSDGWGSFSAASVAALHEHTNPARVIEAGPFPIATATRRVTQWLVQSHRWRQQTREQSLREDRLFVQLAQAQTRSFRLTVALVAVAVILAAVLMR